MRLRGTDISVLEEEGLDSEGAVTSKSKLQSKVKALSGVDILTATGEYKSTYTILSQIADVWADINDMDQAALLELLAGKRNSSVLAAILQNPEELKKAFEDANNASGSALKENEKYLDSIQGKIDQFNNATQAMWSNFLDSDVVKDIVQIGTWIIKLIDNVGVLKSAFIAFAAISMVKNKMGPIAFLQSISDIITGAASKVNGYTTSIMSMVAANTAVAQSTELTTVGSLKNAMAVAKVDAANKNAILSSLGLASADKAQSISRDTLTASTISTMVAEGQLTQAQANTIMSLLGISAASNEVNAARMNELLMTTSLTSAQRGQIISQLELSGSLKQLSADEVMNALTSAGMAKADAEAIMAKLGLTVANEGLAASFMTLWTAIWPILALMAGVAAIYGIVKLFDALTVSAKEASEQLEETKNNISGLESELESLQTELDKTKEKIAELAALPSLSLTQQEDLERLEREVELLERQIALKERQLAIEEAKLVEDAEVALKKNWGKTDKNKKDKKKLNKYIDEYEIKQSDAKKLEAMLPYWENWSNIERRDAMSQLSENYGVGTFWDDTQQIIDAINQIDTETTTLASSIEEIFNDPAYAGLTYGMSDEINAFLDDYNNMQLKWEKALYGDNSTASIIESLWGPNASKEMKSVKEKIDKIMAENGDWASDDEKWQSKNNAIKEYIDSLDETKDGYHQLDYVINELGKTSQDIADYFTVLNGKFNSNTIDGVTKQYTLAAEAINKFKDGLSAIGFDANGNKLLINFDDLFKFDNKTKKWEADAEKVSQILKGADEKTRQQFTTYITNIKNAKQEAEDAGKGFDITAAFTQASKNIEIDGLLRVIDITKESLSSTNQVTFKGIANEINGLIDTFDEFGKALEDTASAMDTLYKAQEQMNSCGRVSVKTALELMQSTEDWTSVLKINGDTIELQDGAENALIQSRLNLIEQNINTALSEAELQYAKLEGADATLLQGETDLTVVEAQKEFDKAMNQSAAVSAGLGAAAGNLIEKLKALAKLDFDSDAWNTSITSAFTSAYDSALTVLENQSNQETAEDIKKRIEDLREQKNIIDQLKKNPNAFKDYYDFDENPGDKYGNGANDLFQKEMDYWENRISANQAKYEQLQNEIDLLESKGQKADASFYEEQIKLENERKWLLEQQKNAANAHLATLEEGSEEWWEVANTINDIEGELDDITASIVDLQDAIGEIDTYKFEEFNNRLDNLTSKLDTIRNLIAPDGEEDWFDDEGNWTDKGVGVLGTYVHDLEFFKQGYQNTMDELAKYKSPYAGNEKYYEELGIHSEQEYYDKTEELISQQYNYAESISDTEQSIVDMYESNIDAVEEYTETLIDSYNDYIDSVKEALDAERDLYDFKKNVQKQAKDIASLERRIASLSGSTNASDIAERRKLEAQLYESRESLNDTYYDHAKESQQNALDAEASAYEETMTQMVEGMRTSLEEATSDMETFLDGVTTLVSLNAGAVLDAYKNTGLELDPALTTPWENAKNAVGAYSGDALGLMNTWAQNGFLTTFSDTVNGSLTSPWNAGSTAVDAFKTGVSTAMANVVSTIETNVKKAKDSLASLTSVIKTTTVTANGSVGENYTGNNTTGGNNTSQSHTASMHSVGMLTTYQSFYVKRQDGGKVYSKKTINGADYLYNDSYGTYFLLSSGRFSRTKDDDGRIWESYTFPRYTPYYKYYAKGTTGTSRDQWAITDEPQFGDELVLVPTAQGNLSYMRKGTGVVPADLTSNLMEWGKFTPDSLNLGTGVNVNMINNAVIKPQYDFNFDSLVHVDHCDQGTLKDLEKMVDNKIDKFSKDLNYSIKRFAR